MMTVSQTWVTSWAMPRRYCWYSRSTAAGRSNLRGRLCLDRIVGRLVGPRLWLQSVALLDNQILASLLFTDGAQAHSSLQSVHFLGLGVRVCLAHVGHLLFCGDAKRRPLDPPVIWRP